MDDNQDIDSVDIGPDDPHILKHKYYFINEIVEDKLRRYMWTSCTDVSIRDSIMEHAEELIKQIIRKQKLHIIYPGQDDSAFGDLVQIAWCQLERTLYKFRARPHCRVCYRPERPLDSILYVPDELEYDIITFDELFTHIGLTKLKKNYTGDHGRNKLEKLRSYIKDNKAISKKAYNIGSTCPYCNGNLSNYPTIEPKQGTFGGSASILYRGASKVFNMWSQISRTVILAFCKKDNRDRKNSGTYRGYLIGKSRPTVDNKFSRFINEAFEVFKYNDDYLLCLKALSKLVELDDRPHDGLVAKIVQSTGLPRQIVSGFLKSIRLRASEFSDSPLAKDPYRNITHKDNTPDDDD